MHDRNELDPHTVTGCLDDRAVMFGNPGVAEGVTLNF
jgi:hypothetical protein